MLVFRWVLLLLFIAGILCFAMYIGTGRVEWRTRGLTIVKWAVLAGLAFFAVLALERMAMVI